MNAINPVIAEILRGATVESRHRGHYAVVNGASQTVLSAGEQQKPIFPRSAIKAFQCVPLVESGAADRFGLTDEEIALCCASHDGEADHVRVARSILAKAGNDEAAYECGAHWPSEEHALHTLVREGGQPLAVHNNCSGKHAGMLAYARHMGFDATGYVTPEHPVQKAVADVLARYCGVDMASAPWGIDGCSVPTWAVPLPNLALAFARLAASGNAVGARIIGAVRKHPFMVGGTTSFDTRIMQAVPRLFIKVGAEGVYCGCIPHAGLGFALKCDDGARRGAEVAAASLLLKLDCWTGEERGTIESFSHHTMRNWRKLEVGEARASF